MTLLKIALENRASGRHSINSTTLVKKHRFTRKQDRARRDGPTEHEEAEPTQQEEAESNELEILSG